MRRTLAAAVVAVATAAVALPVLPTAADPDGTRPDLPTLPDQAASRALQVAERALDGKPAASDPDATMALTELRLALPRLVEAADLAFHDPPQAVAEVPRAEHPRRDVHLRAALRVAERGLELRLLVALQELPVGAALGPLRQAAAQARDRGQGHRGRRG